MRPTTTFPNAVDRSAAATFLERMTGYSLGRKAVTFLVHVNRVM